MSRVKVGVLRTIAERTLDFRCTINTAMGYRVINTQNNDKANIKVQQGGKEFAFEICNDGGYRQRMAQSYDNMVTLYLARNRNN